MSPTVSIHMRNTCVCLASSKQNCDRYISSPKRPSAAIAFMKGWMSWVTASSPAMNWLTRYVALRRCSSLSSSQSWASREKSIAIGSQKRELPLMKRRNGNESQLRPPRRNDEKSSR